MLDNHIIMLEVIPMLYKYSFLHIFLVNLPCSPVSESSASDQSSPSPTAKMVSPSNESRGRVGGWFLGGSVDLDGIDAYAWSVNDVDAAPPGETPLS